MIEKMTIDEEILLIDTYLILLIKHFLQYYLVMYYKKCWNI